MPEKYSIEQDEHGDYYMVVRYKIQEPRLSKKEKTYILSQTEPRFEETGYQYGDTGKIISHSGILLIPA